MSSPKKTEKSRKAKTSVARAAAKNRRSTAKAQKPGQKARAARTAASRSTAKALNRTTAKTKRDAKADAPRNKSAATKLRAAQTRLSKQKAAKSGRPAAKSRTAKLPATKPKLPQVAARNTKANRAPVASHGTPRTVRSTVPNPKEVSAAIEKKRATPHQAAAHSGGVKPVLPERRAQAAAVLALRSLQKPKQAAPAARGREANKPSETQKVIKKAAETPHRPAHQAGPAVTTPAAAAAPTVAAPAMKPLAPGVNPAVAADKAKLAKPMAPVKHGFKPLEFVVYPAHGVGQILAVEEQEVAGFKLELFVISFSKDKMILKVPTPKSIAVGMRKLATAEVVNHALTTLTGRARIKRTMWSRRAQEYEAKINSGDLVAIAEVVRDLYRSEAQPEQSYSERQLYEAALDRVAREIAAVQKLTETESLKVIETQLQKSPRRGKVEDSEGESEDAAEGEENGIEQAA